MLAAFDVYDHTDPMSAADAQTYAGRGWQQWVPIVTALTGLESQKIQVRQSTEAQADTTAPVITLLGNLQITIALNSSDTTDAGDTCTDDVDCVIAVDRTSNVDTLQAGNYTIIYTCTDTAGNTAGVTRSVTVAAEEPVCDFTKHPPENPDSCYGAQSNVPSVPRPLIALDITGNSFRMTWQAPMSDGGSSITFYDVYVDGT